MDHTWDDSANLTACTNVLYSDSGHWSTSIAIDYSYWQRLSKVSQVSTSLSTWESSHWRGQGSFKSTTELQSSPLNSVGLASEQDYSIGAVLQVTEDIGLPMRMLPILCCDVALFPCAMVPHSCNSAANAHSTHFHKPAITIGCWASPCQAEGVQNISPSPSARLCSNNGIKPGVQSNGLLKVANKNDSTDNNSLPLPFRYHPRKSRWGHVVS